MMHRGSISRKFSWMSLLAMFGVVLMHSCAYLTQANPAKWNVFIQYFFTYALNQFAVPMFFMMSGYWFANGVEKQTITELATWEFFWAKKVRTLVVPYICWAFIVMIVCLPLSVICNYVGQRPLLENTVFADGTIWTIINDTLAITKFMPRVNGPLWFLRQLILIFAIAPIIASFYRAKYAEWVLLGISAVELFVVEFGVVGIAGSSLGWFILGMVVAKRRWDNLNVPRLLIYVCGILWLILSVILALNEAKYIPLRGIALIKDRFIPFVAIFFLWGIYDYSMLRVREVPQLLKGTFFVYCFHQAPIIYVLSLGKMIFGKSDLSTLSLVLVGFVSTLVISYSMLFLGKKFFPRITEMLSGGR